MQRVTTDRGEIVHFAGSQLLSPALDAAGAPAFSAGPGDGLARCGWEPFFRALGARRLGVVLDPAGGAGVRFTAPGGSGAGAEGGLSRAVAHSRRFWRALFPPAAPPGAAA
ncbi:hypothetical protein [Anaeromyxobacter diazotrophicus]|uniref:hypothetical protein n=1 Tax=Anaeromyxobacter diazotrophicus TaxID=2590199 RepID=UPI001F457D4E|nr:hypothetical protein [Anaeromyxobacter diazotrophicus]